MNNRRPMLSAKPSALSLALGALWLLAAAALLLFQLLNQPHIQVEWTTATEQNTAGFQLYRSTTADGDFVLITTEFIPGQGTASSGSRYTFVDTEIIPGETYYYLLEEIENDNTSNRYANDIISGRALPVAWWAVLAIVLSTVIGITLIVTGLRKADNPHE